MSTGSERFSEQESFGFFTRAMADWCHDCRLCSASAMNRDSGFGRLMEWHKGWCPAWASRVKVYGPEDLSAS